MSTPIPLILDPATTELILTSDRATLTIGVPIRTDRRDDRSITIESPSASEDISWFFTNRAITVTEIRAIVRQSAASPTVTWSVFFAATRNAAGTEIVTGGTTTTSETSGSDVTAFDDATIPADNFVWVETTASSNVAELGITLFSTRD